MWDGGTQEANARIVDSRFLPSNVEMQMSTTGFGQERHPHYGTPYSGKNADSHSSLMSRHPEKSSVVSCGPMDERVLKTFSVTPEQSDSSRLVSCRPTRESACRSSSLSSSKLLPDNFNDRSRLVEEKTGGGAGRGLANEAQNYSGRGAFAGWLNGITPL